MLFFSLSFNKKKFQCRSFFKIFVQYYAIDLQKVANLLQIGFTCFGGGKMWLLVHIREKSIYKNTILAN